MQDRDVPRMGTTDASVEDETDRSIESIADDFATLIAIFERQLDLVSPDDIETLTHLRKARDAAERGARLSQKLVGLTNSNK